MGIAIVLMSSCVGSGDSDGGGGGGGGGDVCDWCWCWIVVVEHVLFCFLEVKTFENLVAEVVTVAKKKRRGQQVKKVCLNFC